MTGVEGWPIHGRNRRIPGVTLFDGPRQELVDVTPQSVPWLQSLTGANATDDTTLTRIADYLRRDDT